MKYWDALVCRHKIANFRSRACIDNEFFWAQSMIALLVLNLLKSRDTTAVLQRSISV